MNYRTKHVQVGGIKCPCCNPFGENSTKVKRWIHKLERRDTDANIKRDVALYYREKDEGNGCTHRLCDRNTC